MGDHGETSSEGGRWEMIAQAEELVKRHMAQYDPSHDWAHVHRVRKAAMKIATTLESNPDELVVELVALFHDMAAKYTETSSLPTLLEPFFTSSLTQSALSPDQQALILRIIPCISWTAEKRFRARGEWSEWHDSCPELHAVQDADRLDAIGAVGVLRCAAFSGAKGRRLVDEDDGEGSAEGHFEEKLLLIKDRMKTAAGKEEALRRHQTMLQFLDFLRAEKSFLS